MTHRAALGLLVLAMAAPATAGPPEAESAGWRFGLSGLFGTPRGAFDRHVGAGGGLSTHALWTAPGDVFGLRIDGTWLLYGSETLREPVSGTGGRISLATVRTDNWIGSLTAGPQLMAPRGPVRPYAHAFAGVSYFSTTSDLIAPDEFTTFATTTTTTTTNYDDATFSYGAGGGVLVTLGTGGAWLDLGARYVASDTVSFLARGDIDAEGAFVPRRSKADTLEFRLGVTVRP